MKAKTILSVLAIWALAGFLTVPVAAQKFELNPYAGAVLAPSNVDFGGGSFELKEEGLYGIRAGLFLTKNFEVEGNFGYINHFEFEDTDPESRGILWEASGKYHFFNGRLQPFATAGVGGITAVVDEDEPGFLNAAAPVFEDNDTFFTFSYGGGLSAPSLWGPLGLRGDVRGRTIPNLHGEAVTWLELTGGVTLTFGE